MAASDVPATLEHDARPGTFAWSQRLSTLALARLPILVMLIALGARGVTDSDIWGHMRIGLDLLATRALPAVDRYSFTSAQPWINHEWLSDVLFAFAYSRGGLVLLTVLRALSLASVLFVVDRGLRSVPWPFRDLLMAVIVISSLPLLGTVRKSFPFPCTPLPSSHFLATQCGCPPSSWSGPIFMAVGCLDWALSL